MDAASLFGEGHVEAVINENARRTPRVACLLRNAPQCFACERGRQFPRQIFLAQLNPIDASGGGGFDLFQKKLDPIILGRDRQTAAVGDVTEDGLSIRKRFGIERRTIWGGHWKDQDANR